MLKLVRMSTVGFSLDIFCRGFLNELSSEYDVVALSNSDEALDRIGIRENVRTIGIKMHRRISPLQDLVSLFKLIRVFRKERPDILHTMTPKAGLLGMIAAKIAGVPVRIHTFTGLLFPTAHGLQRKILTLTDKITCACATHIIPEGEGVKNDLIVNNITQKPLNVLGFGNICGIDTEHFKLTTDLKHEASLLRQKFNIPKDARVFIFIGRFVQDKGLRELLKAFRSIGNPNCHLLLVGDVENGAGDISKSEFQDIPHLHLSDGWVSDVKLWLAAADILVFPSYREGFPNVVLEAGAMGLPSIVTDINGSREIISNGDNGIIIPSHDAIQLADAMRKLADSPKEILQAMGKAARDNVIAKFTQRFVRDCLKNYYRQIIDETHLYRHPNR